MFLMKPGLSLFALLVPASFAAYAGAIDVTYAVTGSTGAWDLNFTVANNLTSWPTQDIYQFGVELSGPGVIGSPAGYDGTITGSWTNFFNGGGPYFYNNIWDDFNDLNHLLPGTSLSGFIAEIGDPTPPTSVRWFAFTVPYTLEATDIYTGTDAFTIDPSMLTAGFEGATTAVVTATFEPSTTVTLLIGGLGIALRRRKRRGQSRYVNF